MGTTKRFGVELTDLCTLGIINTIVLIRKHFPETGLKEAKEACDIIRYKSAKSVTIVTGVSRQKARTFLWSLKREGGGGRVIG